jgi:hypothetical protein
MYDHPARTGTQFAALPQPKGSFHEASASSSCELRMLAIASVEPTPMQIASAHELRDADVPLIAER